MIAAATTASMERVGASAPERIRALVDALPEVYQQIYSYPEFAVEASRSCADRLVTLTEVHDALALELGRRVRVLDLGCAQGFFSLHLAARGASVVGVDFAPANVALCLALQAQHPELDASFVAGNIEDFLALVEENDFDLVLGLSVFHHLVHEHGVPTVTALLGDVARKIPVGLFEMALAEEPLYWGPSQPSDPRELLSKFTYVKSLGEHQTHLSMIVRPLFLTTRGDAVGHR